MPLTFIDATPKDRGNSLKPGALGKIQSHIASSKHARNRAVVVQEQSEKGLRAGTSGRLSVRRSPSVREAWPFNGILLTLQASSR